MKAVYNGGKEVDVEVSDKAVIIDTGSDIVGFDIQAIRTVRKRDSGEIVIAYSAGSELKSVTIKPLNDSDRANLLLALTKKEGGSQSPVSNEVIDDEFERLYQKWKNRLERELQLALEGKHKIDEKEQGEFSDDTLPMSDILKKRYNANPMDLPLNHDETPYEFQVCAAKIIYLNHLYQLIEVISDYSYALPDGEVPYYADGFGFTLEDYEDLFRYYGIEVPALPEEVRKKVKERWETDLVLDVPVEEGEEFEFPADYKTWFREKD